MEWQNAVVVTVNTNIAIEEVAILEKQLAGKASFMEESPVGDRKSDDVVMKATATILKHKILASQILSLLLGALGEET